MRALGKLPAVKDTRLVALHQVMPAALPAIPKSTNWRAHLPDTGVDMLGNDAFGCCVWATSLHYIQLAALYVSGANLRPTEEECLGPDGYGSTGFDPTKPDTDKGTVVAGSGGALDHWIRNGMVCGGRRNFLRSAVIIEHTSLDQLRLALALGPVMAGANMTEADMNSLYMFIASGQPPKGGHEFLILGHETLASGKTYYDIETWDGMWRADDNWIQAQMDEACMPLDPAFFGPSGMDPADMDMASVAAAVARIKAN